MVDGDAVKRAQQVSELEMRMSRTEAIRHLNDISDDNERAIARVLAIEGMRASERAMTTLEYRLQQAALLKAVITLQKKGNR